MQEQLKEGMDVKEVVLPVPFSLMRVIYMAFTSVCLVPVDPIWTGMEGLNWGMIFSEVG